MPAAEHVKRQVAVAIIVAVEEAAFLMAVQRVVGGVEVEDDLLGRPVVRLEQQVDEQGLDRRGLMGDLAVLRGRLRDSSSRFSVDLPATGAQSSRLASSLRQHRHQRVVTKLVVIIRILVAERNAEHALPDERGNGVLDEPRVSRVTKTSRNPANQAQTLVGGDQQQAARVGRQRAAVELATTDRPSTRPNMLRSALHSVCIGPPLQISASRSHKITFA